MCIFFFFNDTATTEIYTLSLHDALPIWNEREWYPIIVGSPSKVPTNVALTLLLPVRSEEHTSELQSQSNIVCRLLLEKKNRPCCPYVSSRDGRATRCALSRC